MSSSARRPLPAADARLLFLLKRQEFMEYLRRGDAEGQKQALACARQDLAPLALNACPEAYVDFKLALQTLVYDEHAQASPVAELWSCDTRRRLAGRLSRTLRQAHGVPAPRLRRLLAYLVITHRLLVRPSAPVPAGEEGAYALIDELGCDVREDPPLAHEDASFSQAAFPEADIQGLKEAAQLTRQEAVDALRHTKGDAEQAFLNELDALALNQDLVDLLVREYASFRDLLADWEDSASSGGGSPAHGCGVPVAMDIDGAQPPVDPSDAAPRADVEQGCYEEALASIETHVPGLLSVNPDVAFALQRARFQAAAKAGDGGKALHLARSELGPLAQAFPQLLPQLKVALASLIPSKRHPPGAAPISPPVLAQLVADELRRALGIQEPRLIGLLKVLLASHTTWFRAQRCKDRFEACLGLNALRASPCAGPCAPPKAPGQERLVESLVFGPDSQDVSNGREAVPGGGGGSGEGLGFWDRAGDGGDRAGGESSDGEGDMSEEPDEDGLSEDMILLTMEFTGLGRAEAIEMLYQFGGDPNAVMAHLFP
ncbi:hypothetical protein WJX81_001484 [Elliptochloris bilobata]|uniref:CTLH domain-containing protein n=1 Tax=Elliptochloris bilobata TaxID=381761 RepID=A0AAW1RKQ9_9CHLO